MTLNNFSDEIGTDEIGTDKIAIDGTDADETDSTQPIEEALLQQYDSQRSQRRMALT